MSLFSSEVNVATDDLEAVVVIDDELVVLSVRIVLVNFRLSKGLSGEVGSSALEGFSICVLVVKFEVEERLTTGLLVGAAEYGLTEMEGPGNVVSSADAVIFRSELGLGTNAAAALTCSSLVGN